MKGSFHTKTDPTTAGPRPHVLSQALWTPSDPSRPAQLSTAPSLPHPNPNTAFSCSPPSSRLPGSGKSVMSLGLHDLICEMIMTSLTLIQIMSLTESKKKALLWTG